MKTNEPRRSPTTTSFSLFVKGGADFAGERFGCARRWISPRSSRRWRKVASRRPSCLDLPGCLPTCRANLDRTTAHDHAFRDPASCHTAPKRCTTSSPTCRPTPPFLPWGLGRRRGTLARRERGIDRRRGGRPRDLVQGVPRTLPAAGCASGPSGGSRPNTSRGRSATCARSGSSPRPRRSLRGAFSSSISSFATGMLGAAAGLFFEDAMQRIVRAFERRAAELYG